MARTWGSPLYPAEPAEQPLSAIHRDRSDYAEHTTNQNSFPWQPPPARIADQSPLTCTSGSNATVKPHLTPRPESISTFGTQFSTLL